MKRWIRKHLKLERLDVWDGFDRRSKPKRKTDLMGDLNEGKTVKKRPKAQGY